MTRDPVAPVPATALALPDAAWVDRAATVVRDTEGAPLSAGSVVVLARALEELERDIRDEWAEASAHGPMTVTVARRIRNLAIAKLSRVFKRVWGQSSSLSGSVSTALGRMVVASLDVLRDPLRDDPGSDARRAVGVQPAVGQPEDAAIDEDALARAIRDLLARRRLPICLILPETGYDGLVRVLLEQRAYLRAHAGTLMLRQEFPLGGRRSKLAPPPAT